MEGQTFQDEHGIPGVSTDVVVKFKLVFDNKDNRYEFQSLSLGGVSAMKMRQSVTNKVIVTKEDFKNATADPFDSFSAAAKMIANDHNLTADDHAKIVNIYGPGKITKPNLEDYLESLKAQKPNGGDGQEKPLTGEQQSGTDPIPPFGIAQ